MALESSAARGQWGVGASSSQGRAGGGPSCSRGVGTGWAPSHPGQLLKAVSRAGHLKGLPSFQHLGDRKAVIVGGAHSCGRNACVRAAG